MFCWSKLATIETTVYRKPTDSNMFLKRRTFAPDAWKWGPLRTLIKHAYFVSSNEIYLEQVLNHLKFVLKGTIIFLNGLYFSS